MLAFLHQHRSSSTLCCWSYVHFPIRCRFKNNNTFWLGYRPESKSFEACRSSCPPCKYPRRSGKAGKLKFYTIVESCTILWYYQKKIMDKRTKLQVGQLENRMSVISEQEEAAQKRLIAAEDALRNEASSHTASTALNVTLPPQLFFLMREKGKRGGDGRSYGMKWSSYNTFVRPARPGAWASSVERCRSLRSLLAPSFPLSESISASPQP